MDATATFTFSKFEEVTAEQLTGLSAEQVNAIWLQNDENTRTLWDEYRDHYTDTGEYYQSYIKAKFPLDATDANCLIAMTDLHLEEIKQQQEQRVMAA
jgi:hypothetical protein